MTNEVRLYGGEYEWGFRVEKGMKKKDLPEYLKPSLGPQEGALWPLEFESGSFWFVEWAWPKDEKGDTQVLWGWPEPEKTEVLPGDYLAYYNWGIVLLPNYSNIGKPRGFKPRKVVYDQWSRMGYGQIPIGCDV